MNKGKPLLEAEREAGELDRKIRALAEGKPSAGGSIDSENRPLIRKLGTIEGGPAVARSGEGWFRKISRIEPLNLVGTARCAVRAALSGATMPPAASRAGTSQRDP